MVLWLLMVWKPEYGHRRRAYNAAYYQRNKARIRVQNRAWRRAHPESGARHREANRERYRAWVRAWRERNPEAARLKVVKRRARLAGATGTFTLQEWQEKVALLGGRCIYCGAAAPLTVDHKVPLSRGGTNSIDNVLPACSRCNSAKGTRTAQEFLALH